MASWKSKALASLRRHLEQNTVQFTEKAKNELAALDLYELDAVEMMAEFTSRDLVDRIQSTSSCEPLHVFKPRLGSLRFYVKMAFRSYCDVISFHPDSGEEIDDQDSNQRF